MTSIKEMRENQARIWDTAKSLRDQITDNMKEDRAKELDEQFDRAMSEFDALQSQIDREEVLARAKAKIDAVDNRRPNGSGAAAGTDGGTAPTYREAFAKWIAAGGVTGDMEPEARAVLRAGYGQLEQRAQTAGTNTAGGYTVPTELQNVLIRSMLQWGPMYSDSLTTVITTPSGNPIPFPTVNDTGRTVSVTAEGVTLGDTGAKDAVFGQKSLGSFSFNTEWLRVSKELAEDSILAMESLLGDLLGEGLGRRANLELTTGVGTTAPSGILTGSTAGKTAVSTTAFTSDEVMDLLHSVDPAYRQSPKTRFMFHDTILLTLKKLKDGQGNYLWQMGDIQGGEPARLLGYEYSINQAMPSALTTGQKLILFGDFSKYYVRKVGSVMIGAIQDKDFWPGFGIAGYMRLDGALMDTAAVKHLKLA